jgi:predicted PurR-regulated permease PerM
MAPSPRRILLPVLLGLLALLCIAVLRPFIVPVVWAALLVYVSAPLHRRVLGLCHGRATAAALVTTALVALVLIVPVAMLAVLLQREIASLYQAIAGADETPLATLLRTIPWVGDTIAEALGSYAGDGVSIRQLILDWAQDSRAQLLRALGSVGRNAAKAFFTVLTAFFFYRDGTSLVRQAGRILEHLAGDRLDRYWHAAGGMVRAVVLGLLVTALAQGLLAGVGYALVGVDAPVLLGALTALASIVPVIGTGLVWGVVAAALLLTGHAWPGLALIAWGTVLVHPVDNLVRPLLISNATQLPFLLVMFGIIGGLAAFGLVGLFVGPVVLAVATAVWRERVGLAARAPPGSEA